MKRVWLNGRKVLIRGLVVNYSMDYVRGSFEGKGERG
jgi:hypothetical protein